MKPAGDEAGAGVPIRFLSWWSRTAGRINPVAVIVAAWTLLVLPLVFLRGFNSDEGLAVTIARTAIEDGHWLSPHMFNVRFVERPTLLSWIVAAISWPFGAVSLVSARLPVALFLLGGGLAIYALLRRVSASPAAALFGAALFLACPLVVRSYVMITADMPLSVLLFAAFALWWDAHARGAIRLGRWIAIGVLLALAGLMKGPQPVAYFALGVGVFVLLRRRWGEIPGLALAGLLCALPLAAWYAAVYTPGDETQWASFMRFRPAVPLADPLTAVLKLFANTLPAALAVLAYALTVRGDQRATKEFVLATSCYAFIAAAVVLFWPGGSTPRYYFPAILPLCVLGGLAYDRLAGCLPQVLAPVLALTLVILAYGLAYSLVAAPLMPADFRSSKIDAERVTRLVQAQPATIYQSGTTGLNVLPLVPARIHTIGGSLRDIAAIAPPAWLALPAELAEHVVAGRPGAKVVLTFGSSGEWRLVRLDQP